MDDDVIAAELLDIARRHCKLALEHGRTNTSPERRRAIQDEIQALRNARTALLSSCHGRGRD